MSTQKHWARFLVVVPRPMPAAPRRDLIVAARQFPAAAVCHRYLAVVPRPLPAAPFLVRRRYLTVVLDRFLRRCDAVASGKEHSVDKLSLWTQQSL